MIAQLQQSKYKSPYHSMKCIRKNEYFRQKVKELHSKLLQAKNMVPNHNLYYGLLAESILRNFLREVLPMRVGICQGFIEQNGKLSQQCDIIIYDQLNYASTYSYGEIQVIPNVSVIAVVEVKVSVTLEAFQSTLDAFKELAQMKIPNKYLFIYAGPTIKTLEKYFYPKRTDSNKLCVGVPLYDHSDEAMLPKAILNLKRDYYLMKDLVPDVDMIGYMAYTSIDIGGDKIACLQSFMENIMELIIPTNEINKPPYLNSGTSESEGEDELSEMKAFDGFGLIRL